MSKFFVTHPQELKPRALIELTDAEAISHAEQLESDGLFLTPVSEISLKFISLFGDPLDCEIQKTRNYVEKAI